MSGRLWSDPSRSGQAKLGHDRSGWVRYRVVLSVRSGQKGQIRPPQVNSGKVRSSQLKSGQSKLREVKPQIRSNPFRSGHFRSDQACISSGQKLSLVKLNQVSSSQKNYCQISSALSREG